MRPRSFTLLEVVIGLALLGGMGVWLLGLQSDALRQYRYARMRSQVAERVEQLLWEWSASGMPVTLPATGRFDDRLSWRREVAPIRVVSGVLPSQVSIVVTLHVPHEQSREIYRVAWLIPREEAR